MMLRGVLIPCSLFDPSLLRMFQPLLRLLLSPTRSPLRFIPFFAPFPLSPLHSFVCLTGGDDALQADDVGVVKLSQDAGLAEEGATLFVRAAGAYRLYGHWQLPLAGQLEAAATHLAEITWSGGGIGGAGWKDGKGRQTNKGHNSC